MPPGDARSKILWISGPENRQNGFRVTKFWRTLPEGPPENSSQNRKFFFQFTIFKTVDCWACAMIELMGVLIALLATEQVEDER